MTQSYLRDRSDVMPSMSEKRVEVYLDACSIRGTLHTVHARVSDHLGSTDVVLRLTDSRVVLRDGSTIAQNTSSFINKSEILFVVDLTPLPAGHAGLQVERDTRPVVVNVGTIWIRGHAHIPVDGDLDSYFSGAMNRFMAITEASVVGFEGAEPRTVLINRDQLNAMLMDPAQARQA